ncbi:foldase protein PrsA [Sedimentitalea todarodis]|uniref:Parvulin-like PPIase n=1 Tax=Sedimentitalea todarodis TaxID=1631240 RepID=A0ABU3VKA6_9RHOB|nr:peptidylprolyl isomerase [Sedimentitalea todarodis]MDU9006617.1 peptidylprolyl isomerase [Sedimentitalea todarodis]
MPKHLTFLPALALSAVISSTAMADSAPDADTVVASVNGEEITLGHVIMAGATLPEQYQQVPADVLYNAILDQLIQQTALVQSREGDVPAVVEISLDNERRSLLAADAIETAMDGIGSEADIRAAYDAKYSEGDGEVEFNASHILVETKEQADAIKAELDEGADFAETAKARSTGPSGPNGGELGWFSDGQMVPEFQEAVSTLEAGQVSDPVQTQFGWHVIILNDKRDKEAPELEAVTEELLAELRQNAIEDRIEELTSKAKIERPVVEGLKPEMIKDLGLIGN